MPCVTLIHSSFQLCFSSGRIVAKTYQYRLYCYSSWKYALLWVVSLGKVIGVLMHWLLAIWEIPVRVGFQVR